jgi:hypothetical protein
MALEGLPCSIRFAVCMPHDPHDLAPPSKSAAQVRDEMLFA